MEDNLALEPAGGLSEPARIADTFVAPSKTFADILRNASWWGPFVLMFVLSLASTLTVQKKVGFATVSEVQMMKNKAASEQMAQLPPEERAHRMALSTTITQYVSYGVIVLITLGILLFSLVLWLSVNFILGAETKYSQILALYWYASLPLILLSVLNIILLLAGVGTENYDIQNAVGTNIGYYVPDAAPWLKSLLTSLDVLRLWNLVLLTLGISIIAKKTKAQAATIVFGWWGLITLLGVAWRAAMG